MAQSVQWVSYGLYGGGIVFCLFVCLFVCFFFFPTSGGIVLDSFAQLSDRLFSYPSLCPVDAEDYFYRGHSKRCTKLIILIHLMPGLRMVVVLYLQSWLRLLV
jgi:hypothetical protein